MLLNKLMLLLSGSTIPAGSWAGIQAPQGLQAQSKDLFARLLEFIYTIAHAIGQGIVNILQMIVPAVKVPQELVDPIGMLAILTICLAVAEVAKRLVWIVVAVGWLLIVIRVVLVILKHA